ncbi:hypothetical protein Godav_023163 [Gossypium davidsonii]|uniref:Uncharacterized protein n=1 Tax=Gossypium davidsonii TaxID=34287 RepID=A0A7J8SQN9_GOSDV|nr:hypothetical protein [Gossypium davidsonii]
MDNVDYMWMDEDLDYDSDIYEEGNWLKKWLNSLDRDSLQDQYVIDLPQKAELMIFTANLVEECSKSKKSVIKSKDKQALLGDLLNLNEICEFYDAPFYSKDFFNNTDLDKFEDIDMDDVMKCLTQDRGTRIAPALNVSNVNTFRAILLYGILQSKQICLRRWIYCKMRHCTHSQKAEIFFPHLVTESYQKTHHGSEEEKVTSENESEQGLPREEDDYEAAF